MHEDLSDMQLKCQYGITDNGFLLYAAIAHVIMDPHVKLSVVNPTPA